MSIRNLFGRCMSEPDVNSRLIFLGHGIASVIGTLALVIGFLRTTADKQANYPMMVLALAGTAGGAAVGRYLTKRNGRDGDEREEHEGSARVDAPK